MKHTEDFCMGIRPTSHIFKDIFNNSDCVALDLYLWQPLIRSTNVIKPTVSTQA